MRKTLAVTTTALAVLATATPAQAAPMDPLAALRKQLIEGRGVSFAEISPNLSGSKPAVERKGLLQYGKAGIVASDVTGKLNFEDKNGRKAAPESPLRVPERTIRIGRTSYVRGLIVGAMLPKGKSWWKQSPGWTSGYSARFGDYLNVAEPATLKALLAHAKRSGNTYRGEISEKELFRVSAWTRATAYWGPDKKAKIGWRLVVSTSGLPRQLTTYAGGISGPKRRETRFTGWGAKVAIKAPPADEVTTKLEGDGPPPLPSGPGR
ncbi:hypothetical protein [Streptosporangium sp. 'caverna']|uniref:hypothetical protein n=1 Tax=Streptosporangium sp. 'caverna' TaxID=2202249 RepID=UPI000D7E3F56|nr:hypothetical protein [Streptosporangium sp. 'caverna']AWS47056.1 hypothetical protein DKM19_42940 [Streptosporangium sp. 'caverna']